MSPYYQRLRKSIGSGLLLIPSVAAVILDSQGRLLLQEKHDGTWSLPAGAIEPGETPEAAAAREIAEETGLQCIDSKIIRVLGGSAFRHTYQNGHQVEYLIVLFRCQVNALEGVAPTDHEETLSLRYFARDEFPGLSLPYDINDLFPVPGTVSTI